MQTIGQTLKQTRESKRLTLEKVFEATRIRVPYLQALESDDLSAMPSPVQARGYLRNYAEYLGLNFDQLLDEMRVQTSSDEMLTPMDSTPAQADSTPPLDSAQATTPLSTGQPARRKKADSKPASFDAAQDKPDPSPSKPRRATDPSPSKSRRAKTGVKSATDSSPSKPRRVRKNVDLESVAEPQPEITQPIKEAEPEPVAEPIIQDSVSEESPQPDVSDGLWQSWLNRLSSVITIRAKVKQESLPIVPQVEEETPQLADDDQSEPSTSQPEDSQPSDEIFKEIGRELRARREMLGLHLDEVERNTHVKAHYLEALETGAMENLPSTVQTRGMLSNYSSFLDLDVDAILLRFADALQTRHRERNPQKPARQPGEAITSKLPPLRSFVAGDLVFGIGIAVLLVGFLIWAINRVVTLQNQEVIQSTAPSISDVLLATTDPSLFTPTATLSLVEDDAPTVTIVIPTQNLNVNVQVNLLAVERTYMRVIVDGEEVFNGRVIPGTAYPFEAEEQVEVLVGSGAAIRVVYNGRDLGLLGGFGEVISNIYREEEIITPTAFPTQQPTATFTPTATVRPTRTQIPTATPKVTGTP
ncbi:MAG: DUF4115 domain-containing protein [Anaerolineales bacterium]